MPSAETRDEQLREAAALAKVDGWVRRGGRVLDLDKLERAGTYLVERGTSEVWVHAPGEPRAGRDPKQDACGITDGPGFGVRWYRAARDEKGQLLTLDALVTRDRQAETRANRQRDRELARLRKEARPVTVSDLDGGERLTLGAAAERIKEAGGKLELRAGRLVVQLPPEALGLWGHAAKTAALRLYAAEEVVTTCLREKRPLPDAETTPGGAVVE